VGRLFTAFPVGERLIIVPEQDVTLATPNHAPAPTRLSLVMSAGAFGSGEHETSASCLEELEQLGNLHGKKVLDLGSGTGILAIAALKLGASSALCVDIESKAVETCKYNSKLNQVEDQVQHCCGTIADIGAETFDLIIANIYGDILIDIAAELVPLANPGSIILLSGILYEYNFDVRQHYQRQGCTVLKNRMLSEFSTILLLSSQIKI